MIKYKTGYDAEIEEVEVLGETKEFVIVSWNNRNRRESKHGQYTNYFDTWQKAYDYLLGKATKRLESTIEQVGYAEKYLKKIKLLSVAPQAIEIQDEESGCK